MPGYNVYVERERVVAVIAVTRAGRGDVYRFSSVLKADSHPIVQYGDAIIASRTALRQSLTMVECAMAAERVGDKNLGKELRDSLTVTSESMILSLMERLWNRLENLAPAPPTNPVEIVTIIVADRVMTRHTGIHLRPRGAFEMTKDAVAKVEAVEEVTSTNIDHVEAVVGEVTATSAAAAAEAPKRAIPRDPKFSETSIITLLKDKDEKQFGADHNPKKPGSASFDRFARYVDGMTVKAAKEAGIQNGDLDNDVKKGFIDIV
jgi:hypothetical protein